MNARRKSPRAAGAFWSTWMHFIFFIMLLGSLSLATAQTASDLEPNNSCLEAQNIGAISLPFIVTGSLDTPPQIPDVDFIRFEAPAGTLLVADLEGQATNQGTLPDPFIGLFDSNCNLLALNDGYFSPNARLMFAVPTDGMFILATTSCCDGVFSGQGGSSGTYRLTIRLAPPAIGSIHGRLIDAITGQPLRGDTYPFATVNLFRCTDENCFESVAYQSPDSAGQFRFVLDFTNNPLTMGSYQIQSYASEYEPASFAPFWVGEGEDLDVGDLPLQPPPVQFSEIRPCGNLPPEGGHCWYSVRVTNNLPTPIQGSAWSLVQAYGIGSRLDFTNFQAMGLGKMRLSPGQSGVVRFAFNVPPQVRDGATLCTRVLFGQGQHPFFDTLSQRDPLFCILKGFMGGFSVQSEQESRKLLRKPPTGHWNQSDSFHHFKK